MSDLISQNNQPAPIAPIGGLNSQSQQAMQRQVAEVRASLELAKLFPRNTIEARARLLEACQRPGLAEKAIYQYPRGGQKVDGPSIRLAEAAAQCWGNLDFGIVELEQRDGESTVMAFAWDKETNTRQTKVFCVPHTRKAGGQIKTLDDPRDIYEMVANQGARRLRACILGVIPGDIIEDAVQQCTDTMIRAIEQGGKATLEQTIAKMLVEFKKFGVTQDELEAYLGHKVAAITPTEVQDLRGKFESLKDGYAKKEEFFKPVSELERPAAPKKTKSKKKKEEPKPEPQAEAEELPIEEEDGDQLDMGPAEAPTSKELTKVLELLSKADISPDEAAEVLSKLDNPMLKDGQSLSDLSDADCKTLVQYFGKFQERVMDMRKEDD